MLSIQPITSVIYSGAMEPREIIREAREGRKWSQKDLADRAGISQVAIMKIESGVTAQSKFLPKIAQILGLDLAQLDPGLSGVHLPALPPVADPFGPKDFRIYSAAEGGPGEILRSVDPVDWWPRPIEVQRVAGAYGMYIVGESMVPEYRPGQVAVINPNLPHIADRSYIFYAETEDGVVRATVKLLRRQSGDNWFVTQHNPPPGQKNEFTLPKKLWRVAHRIVGRQEPT
jgi:phage repressor protein C with HTH and peptisase S24 domain